MPTARLSCSSNSGSSQMTTSPSRSDAVARYLSQSSAVENPIAMPSPIARHYELNFQEIMQRLKIADSDRPELVVAYTAQASVESLLIGEKEVIVYDQHLGQSFNRLNDLAFANWPPGYVNRWGFKHLAFALAKLNLCQEAALALGLFRLWPVSGEPTALSAKQLPYRSFVTAVQEYFILAHECIHVGLRAPSISIARSEFDDLINRVIEDRPNRDEDPSALHAEMVRDELRALGANDIDTDDEEFVDLIEKHAAEAQQPDLSAILFENEHMREELLCDLVATEFTMASFQSKGGNPRDVLAAILHAFHNLTSCEVIRGQARSHAGLDFKEGLLRLGLRKSVWRDLMCSISIAADVKKGSEINDLFATVTKLHAHTVGDQIIYILPFEFDRGVERIGRDDFGEAETRAVMRTIREMIEYQRVSLFKAADGEVRT